MPALHSELSGILYESCFFYFYFLSDCNPCSLIHLDFVIAMHWIGEVLVIQVLLQSADVTADGIESNLLFGVEVFGLGVSY